MLAGACITRTRGGLARNGDFADPYLCAGYPRTADGITSQWSFGGGTGTSYFRLRLLNDGDRKTDGARSDSCRRAGDALLATQPDAHPKTAFEHCRQGHHAAADCRAPEAADSRGAHLDGYEFRAGGGSPQAGSGSC